MSLPGVDYAVAESMLAVLGDISRFEDGTRMLRVNRPTATATAAITRSGVPVTHSRPMQIPTACSAGTMSTQPAAGEKKNHHVAMVGNRTQDGRIVLHLLRTQERTLANPDQDETKYSRLRVRVTGQKKKTGAKGQPRSASYGSGKRTRAVPALDQIYASEQLPPLAQTAAGEPTITHGNPQIS